MTVLEPRSAMSADVSTEPSDIAKLEAHQRYRVVGTVDLWICQARDGETATAAAGAPGCVLVLRGQVAELDGLLGERLSVVADSETGRANVCRVQVR